MPKSIPEEELRAIRAAIPDGTAGATAQQISAGLRRDVPIRTLQYRLRHMVTVGLLEREGEGRRVRYRPPVDSLAIRARDPGTEHTNGDAYGERNERQPFGGLSAVTADMLSARGAALHEFLQQRPPARRAGAVRRRLLDSYRPNVTAYLGRRERARLAAVGAAGAPGAPGAAAAHLGLRFEIDFVWNSARLAGSRYSELAVRRLLKFGRAADGHDLLETQAVLNQRDALRFLLTAGRTLDDVTIRNLHAILAHNLIPDEAMAGRLRPETTSGRARRANGESEDGALLERFAQLIALATQIEDPFERSFFLLVQLHYVAPFAEMNDRVARVAANLPLLRANLLPLPFVGLPGDLYATAVRGVVERSRVDLLRDLFVWSYERSAARYGGTPAPSQPDQFRLEHDAELRAVIAEVVRQQIPREELDAYVEDRASSRIGPDARDRFLGIVAAELAGLHEGNFARYEITLDELRAWQHA
jgi:hypothetical protein